jgi:hypothetical protein
LPQCKSFARFRGLALWGALLASPISIGPGRAAHAQPPSEESRSAARALLAEGAALFERRDPAAALAKFEQAYALFPSPKIHFNFGQAYRGLGRHAEAITAFQRFLDQATDADASLRQLARTSVEELRAHVATVQVDADVAGAQVAIDGRGVGRTPLGGPLWLEPGVHLLRVTTPDGRTHGEQLQLRAGSTLRLTPRLAPALLPRTSAPPTQPLARPTTAVSTTVAETPPIYRTWWFWTGATVLLAAGATSALLLMNREASLECPTCVNTIGVPD